MRPKSLALLVCSLVCVCVAGCSPSGSVSSTTSTDDDVASVSAAIEGSEMNASATELASQSMKPASVAEVNGAVGAQVEFPEDEFGGIKAVFIAATDSDPERAAIIYDDGDIVVRIMKLDAAGAIDYVTDLDDEPGFAPWMKVVSVQGHEGRAHEKLDVPAEWDERGVAKPGTGVSTGAATVMWSQGAYVVTVASGEKSVSDLLRCAEEIRLSE